MSIGEHIRKKRKTFGLTQIELAERSGVGVRFVRELENGDLPQQRHRLFVSIMLSHAKITYAVLTTSQQ